MPGRPERLGHFDATFGISGDMALGALLDAGARLDAVNAALAALGVPGLRADVGRTDRGGLDCARVQIRWDGGDDQPHAPGPEHHHPRHRGSREITALLTRAQLPAGVRARASAVFAQLASAEGRVHGQPPEDVHFHEVGSEDAIGDVVGVAAALEDLGIGKLTVSPLPAGGGAVSAAHGLLPVPVPAVAVLLAGFDWRPGPVAAELVTPTGAAILAALAQPAASWPSFRLRAAGWGAGRQEFPHHPNACRFVWGEVIPEGSGGPAEGLLAETLWELETHLDDQTPEQIGYVSERLFAAGALDVASSALGMKKQRPGVRLWALVGAEQLDGCVECLFKESSTLGLRVREVRRWSLPRSIERVDTPFGPVRIKVARRGGRILQSAPEYEDCRAAALAHGAPLKDVMAAALAAFTGRAATP